MNAINLPDGSALAFKQAAAVFGRYVTINRAAIDLYDRTNTGPHDDIEAVDLLALNALNAFASMNPMTPMEAMWIERARMAPRVGRITRDPLESLGDAAVVAQKPLVVAALQALEKVKNYGGGGTRVAKLLHRLRPNIVPIWDIKVGEWYGGPAESWDSFLSRAWGDVRRNAVALGELRRELAPELSLVRVWDALLWRLRFEMEQ